MNELEAGRLRGKPSFTSKHFRGSSRLRSRDLRGHAVISLAKSAKNCIYNSCNVNYSFERYNCKPIKGSGEALKQGRQKWNSDISRSATITTRTTRARPMSS